MDWRIMSFENISLILDSGAPIRSALDVSRFQNESGAYRFALRGHRFARRLQTLWPRLLVLCLLSVHMCQASEPAELPPPTTTTLELRTIVAPDPIAAPPGWVDAKRMAKASRQLCGQLRPTDELWLVSTRVESVCGEIWTAGTFDQVDVCRWLDGQWTTTSAQELLGFINTDTERQNALFIHGNRTNLHWAKLRGVETYQKIVVQPESCETLSCDLPPVRWIIWAWPSDPVPGPRLDLEVKLQRAKAQGKILSEFLHGIQQPRLGVLAYSLGAQALTSALCDYDPSPSAPASERPCVAPQLRVVLMAGAIPTNWLCSVDGQACVGRCMHHLMLINNTHDRVLDVYERFTGEAPVGTHGAMIHTPIPTEVYVLQNREIDNHFLQRYLQHGDTRRLIRRGLFETP